MTATDELRRMLDERGVEWCDDGYPTTCTVWAANGIVWHGLWRDDCIELIAHVSPAEAIDATLGRGMCEVEGSILDTYEYNRWEYDLTCGHTIIWGSSEPPNYCPNCGRKVVG